MFTSNPLKERIYFAPHDPLWDCIFFSNSPILEIPAKASNWDFCHIHTPDLISDVQNSLAAKYIKFLRFLSSDIEEKFSNYEIIIYSDHKRFIKNNHILYIIDLMKKNPNKDIFIFQTPKEKTSLFDEINAAMGQSRYRSAMGETLHYISEGIFKSKFSKNARIERTGIIGYRLTNISLKISTLVYDKCIVISQPECQIFWAALTQKFRNFIYSEPEVFDGEIPIWKCPEKIDFIYSNGIENIESIPFYNNKNIFAYKDDLISEQIKKFGNHTRPEFAFSQSFLNENSLIFDIGAHIGTFSLSASTKLNNKGKILAVEGNKTTYLLLKQNLKSNPFTLCVNAYIAASQDVLVSPSYDLVKGNSGATKTVLINANDVFGSNNQAEKAISIDELVEMFFEPTFIKIDIEGLEYQAIIASKFIRTHKPDLYIELCDEHLLHYGGSTLLLVQYLKSLGYSFFENIGERNAAHDNYKIQYVKHPENHKNFWDAFCTVKQNLFFIKLKSVSKVDKLYSFIAKTFNIFSN